MKIAISTTGRTLTSSLDSRFGRASLFLIYDTESKTYEVIENSFANAGQGAGTKAAETVVKAKASIVITGECGPKALKILQQAHVKIYSAKEMSVADSLAAFEAGNLSEVLSA